MPAQRHTETLCAFHHANFCLLASSLLPWPGKCTESGGFWMSKSEETQVYPVLKSFICWNDVYMLQVFLAAPMTEQSCSCDATQYTLMGGWLILTVQNIQADYLLNVLASQSRSFFHSLNGWMRKCKIYRSSKPQLFIYLFFWICNLTLLYGASLCRWCCK